MDPGKLIDLGIGGAALFLVYLLVGKLLAHCSVQIDKVVKSNETTTERIANTFQESTRELSKELTKELRAHTDKLTDRLILIGKDGKDDGSEEAPE